jgi:RHS repeat-associated protein
MKAVQVSQHFAVTSFPAPAYCKSAFWTLLLLPWILVGLCAGQANPTTPDPGAGDLLFSSEVPLGNNVKFNFATSNVNVSVPVRSKSGKIPFSYQISANSHMYVAKVLGSSYWLSPLLNYYGAFTVTTNPSIGAENWFATPTPNIGFFLTNGTSNCVWYFVDGQGTSHDFPSLPYSLGCSNPYYTGDVVATDGSGYTLLYQNSAGLIADKSGDIINSTFDVKSGCLGPTQGTDTLTDPDGVTLSDNWQFTYYYNNCPVGGRTDVYTDTMTSVPVLTATQIVPQTSVYQATYAYTDATGTNQQVVVKYQSYTVTTLFGCSGITDLTNQQDYLPYEIDVPGGGSYAILYEDTIPGNAAAITGRIWQVTNPTGGNVTFTYADSPTGGPHHGMNCSSTVVPYTTVTVNDGRNHVGTWTYQNTNASATANNFTVTVTDPNGNQTVHLFSGTTNGPGGVFPTEVQSYNGSAPASSRDLDYYFAAPNNGAAGLLAASRICYNNSFTNCATPTTAITYPVYQKDIYKYPVINGVMQSPSLEETKYDYNPSTAVTHGNVVASSEWGFGATYPPSNSTVSTTTIAYGSWNGSSCARISAYIVGSPCDITIGNLVSGNLKNVTKHSRSVYNTDGHLTLAYDYPGTTVIPPGMAWQANTYYSLDGVVVASSVEGGDLWQVSVAGAGGTSQPFSSGHAVGYTVTDNQVTWMLIETAASLTWQPSTQYNPNRQVNGKRVGQYIAATSGSSGQFLFKLVPTIFPTIIQQPANPQPNTSTGDYVNLYYFNTSSNSNPGIWTYNGTNYTTSNLASYAEDHQKVNSLLFNIGGDPNTQPMQEFVLNQAGEIASYSAPSEDATNHYSMVALFSLDIPTAGKYTLLINHDDGMLFGIDEGASLLSGPTQTYESTTAMNGYPVMGGINQDADWSDTYVVSFPSAGQYDVEIDYFQWINEQTLTLQMNTFSPIPIANNTNLESMSTAPAWPIWTTASAPSYPRVTESGTYNAPAGQYSPTGGALTWENHGPITDFVWQANENFTLPNTEIIDPTGNKQAPYRTGYSGTSEPPFALKLNQLTNDNPPLTWINVGSVIGLVTAYTYTPAGVLSQVTDPSGSVTSYSRFICGGLLPQTVTSPADAAGQQLSATVNWTDCNTAVVHRATDANGNSQTWSYNDPLIRPTSFTDKDGTITTTSYTVNTVETVMNFNGGSTTVTSTAAQAPQTGACFGPFPAFACDTESLGSWANPQNVGSATSAATVATDQYDASETIVSTQVSGTAPSQVLTVTMSGSLPNNFGVGSWAMVQGTQESSVNNTGYVYQIQSVNGATFTAAVCATAEPNCPTIVNYTNNTDSGLVRFNNWFSWSLQGTAFGFSVPSSSTISGIAVTANVTTSCSAGSCETGFANGQSAPYLTIGLVGCSTCSLGTPKIVQVPINGTTPVALGGQSDLWGMSPSAGNTGTVNNTGFGVSISVVQPDLGGGPDGKMLWSINNVTMTITYQAAGATKSTDDVLTYLDGFGRTYLTQTHEGIGSSNWDTVESDYNAFGQVVRSTLPFVSTKGATSTTTPGTAYQYDAMGRVTSATDSETPTPGQVTYAYNGQDVLITLSPAPSGERAKVKQMEYDGLDRLRSVCEVTQGQGIWQGASCAQANSETGYLTSYTYDASNRVTNVVMNSNSAPDTATITKTSISNNVLTVTTTNNFLVGAPIMLAGTGESFLNGQTVVVSPTGLSPTQFEATFKAANYSNPADSGTATFPTQQSRSAAFDELGRITTLQDAESGTSSFVYDAAASPCPAYSSAGDLMQKTDAMGDTTCFTYDVMHRLISSNAVSGPYAVNTPGKFFVYDSASVPDPANRTFNAITSNGAGQVAAAFTCYPNCPTAGTTPGSSIQTTEVFSYDALQRPITLYESSWTGSPFMITNEAYFPNGQINYLGITTHDGSPTCPGEDYSNCYVGTSTFYYALDGMGRVSSMSSLIHGLSNLVVTNITYQPATGLPNNIGYFDGDSDSYTYDPNTLRLLTYQVALGGTGGALNGQLNWNSNGSLATSTITSTLNPSGGLSFPTCNYQHDDLLRINSEQCTNGYSESTMTYDPFGNPTQTTQGGHPTWYQAMTFNPQNNQITSFPGCGLNQNCTGPYHDSNGNQILPLYGGAWLWDSYGNFWGNAGSNSPALGYDAFDRPTQAGFVYGGNPLFYRPDGAFFLNTGNTWPNYWAINHMRLPVPGGNDVEVTQNCSFYVCGNDSHPYPYVYAIRHADQHGSHILGTCADATASDGICTYNTYDYVHILDAFGDTEATASGSREAGSFDGALGDFSNTGTWLFPTRQYISSEGRFLHPEGHGNVSLSDPQSWHSYAYARNNPLVFSDPLGTQYDDFGDSDDPDESGDLIDFLDLGSLDSDSYSEAPVVSAVLFYNHADAPTVDPQLTPEAVAILGGAGQLASPSNFLSGMVISFGNTYIAVGNAIANTLDRIESNPSGNILLGIGTIALALRAGNAEPLEEEMEQVSAEIGAGYRSFNAFKAAQGPAEEGMQWHHIVEQTPGNIARFGPEAIHNTNNLVEVPTNLHVGPGSISAFYSSKQVLTESMVVRQFLATQSFAQQRAFGLQVLQNYGLKP